METIIVTYGHSKYSHAYGQSCYCHFSDFPCTSMCIFYMFFIRQSSYNLMIIMCVLLRLCGRSGILLSGDLFRSLFMCFRIGWHVKNVHLEGHFSGDRLATHTVYIMISNIGWFWYILTISYRILMYPTRY